MPPKGRPGRPKGSPNKAPAKKQYGKANAESQEDKYRSFAISYAKDIHCALISSGNIPELAELFVDADAIFKWLNNQPVELLSEPPAPAEKKPEPKPKPKAKAEPVKEKPEPKEEPEEATIYAFGAPEGDVKISNDTVEKVIKAFGRFDITAEDLATVSGLPVAEWTPNIKQTALNHFNKIKSGEWTRDMLFS